MIDKTPPDREPDNDAGEAFEPGVHGTYAKGDYSPAARRDRFRQDQHFAARANPEDGGPDPYGEGGFAGGGPGQSGYGADFNQLQPSQRHETQVSERALRDAGTASKPDR